MPTYRGVGKRSLDLVLSVIALPGLCLVSLIVVPLIRLTDGGPAIYKSRRRGKEGVEFTMLKFRSMVLNAPDLRNPDLSSHASDDDPRVTPIGRILRRTSVDELPQILNVLKGDMSVVGPRPNMTRQKWGELTAVERKRLRVRPGITGLSQALYRNSATTSEKYRMDALYVDRVSLILDIRVILATLASVVQLKNINSPEERPRVDE